MQFQHFSAGVQARAMSVVLKATAGDPMSLAPALRSQLRRIDAEIPAAQVREMRDVLSAAVADRRMSVVLVGASGALALALAVVGLYGVMAFHVAQRTREMGVRLALGASTNTVLVLVIAQGMRLVVSGLAAGTAVALVATMPMAPLLYDVSTRDAVVFAIAPLVLGLAGLLACYLPARRAMRVDPVTALRAE